MLPYEFRNGEIGKTALA